MSSAQHNIPEELLKTSSHSIARLRFKSKSRRIQIIVFAALFAVIGIVTLLRSFAAVGTLKPQGTYTNWQTVDAANARFTSLDSILAIETDPTTVHSLIGYYWATQFGFANGGGYMGIQTLSGNAHTKNALFAIWGETISVENGTNGSVCYIQKEHFDGDAKASGASCNMPLPWQAGDMYRMRLQLTSRDATSMTWQVNLINAKTGQSYTVGKIKKPISIGLLRGDVSDWTEYYTAAGRAECDFPYSKVVWGQPTFNSGQTNVTRATTHQNIIGAGDCVSKITDISGGTRQEMGNPAVVGNILPPLPSGGKYISDLNWASATSGNNIITKDKSVLNDGSPINFAGKVYAKGIGVYSVSEITYKLDGLYSNFVSYVNTQLWSPGRMTYEVWADGAKLYDSGLMDLYSYTKAINVNITGKKELRLVVTGADDGLKYDWAAWADARLIPASGSAPAPTPTPAPSPTPTPTPVQNTSDTTSPSVTISSPANNSTVTYTSLISASSNDNKGVVKMEVYVDGRLMASSTNGSISYTWVSYYATKGAHNITVKSYDAAGNMGQSGITVNK